MYVLNYLLLLLIHHLHYIKHINNYVILTSFVQEHDMVGVLSCLYYKQSNCM